MYLLSSRSTLSSLTSQQQPVSMGGDVAQLAERRTGTLLRQVRFFGAARNFSPSVNFQSRLQNYKGGNPTSDILLAKIRGV